MNQITDPLTCGFGKVLLFDVITEKISIPRQDGETTNAFKSRILQHRFSKFNKSFFKDTVSYKTFTHSSRKVVDLLQNLGKKHPDKKKYSWNVFHKSNKLTPTSQQTHRLFDCNGCLKHQKYKSLLALLPMKSAAHKSKAKQAGLYKEKELKEVTSNVLSELDTLYKETYNTTFTRQMQKIFTGDKINEAQNIARAVIKDTMTQQDETALSR